jgi:hypothetical protein
MRLSSTLALVLVVTGCSPGAPQPEEAKVAPDHALVFTAGDADRLEALIDEDPDQAVQLLERTVAGSLASMSDEQFEAFRLTLVELLDEGRLRRLVRAGRERPATAPEVARLIEDLDAWDAAILRGVDQLDMGYYD